MQPHASYEHTLATNLPGSRRMDGADGFMQTGGEHLSIGFKSPDYKIPHSPMPLDSLQRRVPDELMDLQVQARGDIVGQHPFCQLLRIEQTLCR